MLAVHIGLNNLYLWPLVLVVVLIAKNSQNTGDGFWVWLIYWIMAAAIEAGLIHSRQSH